MTCWLFWAGIDCCLFGFFRQLIPKRKMVNKVRRQFLSSTCVEYDMKETLDTKKKDCFLGKYMRKYSSPFSTSIFSGKI